MIRYCISFFISLTTLLILGNFCLGGDLLKPTDFSHRIHNQITHKTYFPNVGVKLSISRVHDNQLVDTNFGKKIGGQEIAMFKTDGNSVVAVKNEFQYDTRRDEFGYGKKVREIMSYHLSAIKGIQLVEREDINNIIRELDFGETGYVKSKIIPEVEMPHYIAHGFMSLNDGSCINEEKPQFYINSNEKDGNPLMFLIRVYDTRTTFVKYIACGTGKDQGEAIKNAASNLQKHMDLLYPDVAVIEAADKRVFLGGGQNQGLAKGTLFYLVRSQGAKATLDYSELEYIALCEVIMTEPERATALIKKTFSNTIPKIGDWVFYYREPATWQ